MVANAAHLMNFFLGAPVGNDVPKRVQRIIAQQQASSEIIVGWTQMGAIVFFGTFYAISPKAFPQDTPFEPVPWTLGFYSAFTAFRLFAAYRRRLTGSFIALSVVVDMAVLMITIWSFHLQYQAPPTIYLKAPTLLYVFILIALRALRFEASFVILAGLSAALGWLVLFGYAVLFPGDDAMQFTHSYVEYATSLKVLRGAEVDKILSILIVTAVLALCLIRARRLLIASITNVVAANDLTRFFASEVADQIKHAEADPAAGRCDRRQAAILSVDLRGFTKLNFMAWRPTSCSASWASTMRWSYH